MFTDMAGNILFLIYHIKVLYYALDSEKWDISMNGAQTTEFLHAKEVGPPPYTKLAQNEATT